MTDQLENILPNRDPVPFLLSQYTTLRAEIDRRSREQFWCVTLSLTGLGAFLALALNNAELQGSFLIVLAYILMILGFVWNDHAYAIHRIGGYLRTLESKLRDETGVDDELSWESFYNRRRRKLQRVDLGFINLFLPLAYFLIPSAAVLTIAFHAIAKSTLPPFLEYILFVIGCVLLFILIISWILVIKIIKF